MPGLKVRQLAAMAVGNVDDHQMRRLTRKRCPDQQAASIPRPMHVEALFASKNGTFLIILNELAVPSTVVLDNGQCTLSVGLASKRKCDHRKVPRRNPTRS